MWYQCSPRTWQAEIYVGDGSRQPVKVWTCEHLHDTYDAANECASIEIQRRLQVFNEP